MNKVLTILLLGTGSAFAVERPLRQVQDRPNIALLPEYREVVEKLEKKLMTELETTGDPRVIDGGL